MKRLLVVSLILLAITLGCGAREIVVNSTADNGAGTLRGALQSARSGDVITFDPAIFPPDNPATIFPRSELPPISCGHLTIDASNTGVIIDGSDVPGDWKNGLQVYSDHNTVMGLQVVHFKGSGISICSARDNMIGGDPAIGTGPTGQGNQVAGNSIGIDVCDTGTTGNTISGNLIGTSALGAEILGNGSYGVWIESGAGLNTVGPNNIIAYNKAPGVFITGANTRQNTVTQNAIFSNGQDWGYGIHLQDGGNAQAEPPYMTYFSVEDGVVSGAALPDSRIEIFSDDGLQGGVYEGSTHSDAIGRFSFAKGSPLRGPRLTATATTQDGATSQFSRATQGLIMAQFQPGNDLERNPVRSQASEILSENRIGTHLFGFGHPHPWERMFEDEVLAVGLKRLRLAVNDVDWGKVVWDEPETPIRQEYLNWMRELATRGVSLTYTLTFWDKGQYPGGKGLEVPRFRAEDQIARYLAFVTATVNQVKQYVDYYEIWNEPDGEDLDTIQVIAIEDYIRLAKRVIPVIRHADPDAKISVGATTYLIFPPSHEYLFQILQSDIMPMVDGISWHGVYGASPADSFHRDYYYDYPSLVREIKNTAHANGFSGIFFSDELMWRTPETAIVATAHSSNWWPHVYSDAIAAKYLTRGYLLHLGMDVHAAHDGLCPFTMSSSFAVTQNLCVVMAGHESIDMPIEIDIETDGPSAYCAFRYPNGDRILAVWTDGIAQDEDPGVPATIRFPGLAAESVTGIDVLHGFEQELVFEIDGEDTIIRDLLVKDYPILIRLSDATFGPNYEETVGDGFHQLGDVNAAPSNTGGGFDRDGDGVPDDEDFCPDWPGSPETSGC